ncbi:MAG: type II toxin-antitoxin system RelE/ParE family toxin [Candidatus Omnitrophica bacterium]|nr:type II toxin-antitoxin system RelE/ParE family toxin [Candidatus Omnitrophota bacterium]
MTLRRRVTPRKKLLSGARSPSRPSRGVSESTDSVAYEVVFSPRAERDLEGLPQVSRVRIIRKAESLARTPRPPGVEKLEGMDKTYRVRVGDFRIVYEIQDSALVVLVLRVGHRREVYRH